MIMCAVHTVQLLTDLDTLGLQGGNGGGQGGTAGGIMAGSITKPDDVLEGGRAPGNGRQGRHLGGGVGGGEGREVGGEKGGLGG